MIMHLTSKIVEICLSMFIFSIIENHFGSTDVLGTFIQAGYGAGCFQLAGLRFKAMSPRVAVREEILPMSLTALA